MAVHAQLAALCHEDGDLHASSIRCTAEHYPINDVARARFRAQLVADYLDRYDRPSEKATAIITAGVPGAGKSTMLQSFSEDLSSYRKLDADILKIALIEKAVAEGIYDDILARTLDDGYCIAPMELAPLVHRESNKLIELIRRECLGRQENIIIEGTLTWNEQPRALYDQLAEAGYTRILVLGVEVDRTVAHRQAIFRWWEGRQKWRAGEIDALGGRFTPPYAIDDGYSADARSVCTRNALSVLDRARSGEIPNVEVKIYSPSTMGNYVLVDEKSVCRR